MNFSETETDRRAECTGKMWDGMGWVGWVFMGSIFTTKLIEYHFHGYHRCSEVSISENIFFLHIADRVGLY